MSNLHVQRLRYRAIPASFIELIEGSSVDVKTDTFEARLKNGELVFEMRAHFASESEARSVVDPFVHGWSILSGLRRGRAEIFFEFAGAEVIDRSPTSSGGSGNASIQLTSLEVHGTGTSHPIKKGYPSAAPGFRATREVEILWARHQAYIEGREPLTSVAYFCKEFAEAIAGGGEARASEKYKISRAVFSQLGSLSGIQGDYSTARKVVTGKEPEPLSQQQLQWLEAAIRVIIWRVGDPPADDAEVITVDKIPYLFSDDS